VLAGTRAGRSQVAGAVFAGAGRRPSRRQVALAVGVAGLVYGALAGWAVLVPPVRAQVEAPRPPEMEVALFEAAPAPPPPPPETPPPPVRRPRAEPLPQEAPTAAPAQAAAVVAAPAAPEAPVDLTSFTIATGAGALFAGGKTTSSGTSTTAITGAVAADGVANGAGTGKASLARPVMLAEDQWSCPWPAEADALGIDEQTVVIRVTVRADGGLESAQLLEDPGSGFGPETLRCARSNRFLPALDVNGTAVRARSGPIRVRFTR
jgi:protein TonB